MPRPESKSDPATHPPFFIIGSPRTGTGKIGIMEEPSGPSASGFKWPIYLYSGLMFCNAYGRRRILK